MQIREAAILVGGKGTRLKSLVGDRPKPMAEVGHRPFVEWLLLMLARQGIERVVLCTGFMGEYIEDHFRTGSWEGMEIICCREPRPLGTGGALRNALDDMHTDDLLVLNGDSYCRFELGLLQDNYMRNNAAISMLLAHREDTSRYGTVSIDGGGRITAFNEKANSSTSGYVNAGVYVMDKNVIRDIPSATEFSLERDLFPTRIEGGLFSVIGTGPFVDIGTPDSYAASLRILNDELEMLDQTKDNFNA
jgi:NDP-sugar pyrophosphorylase family protein